MFRKLAGYFGEFAGISFDAIGQLVQIILPPLVEIMNELMPTINEITKAILPPMLEIIKQLMPFIKWVVDIIVQELVPILAELIPRSAPWLSRFFLALEVLKKIIPPVIEMVKDLMPAAVSIFEALQPVLKVVIDILGAILPPIIKAFAGTVKFPYRRDPNLYRYLQVAGGGRPGSVECDLPVCRCRRGRWASYL